MTQKPLTEGLLSESQPVLVVADALEIVNQEPACLTGTELRHSMVAAVSGLVLPDLISTEAAQETEAELSSGQRYAWCLNYALSNFDEEGAVDAPALRTHLTKVMVLGQAKYVLFHLRTMGCAIPEYVQSNKISRYFLNGPGIDEAIKTRKLPVALVENTTVTEWMSLRQRERLKEAAADPAASSLTRLKSLAAAIDDLAPSQYQALSGEAMMLAACAHPFAGTANLKDHLKQSLSGISEDEISELLAQLKADGHLARAETGILFVAESGVQLVADELKAAMSTE